MGDSVLCTFIKISIATKKTSNKLNKKQITFPKKLQSLVHSRAAQSNKSRLFVVKREHIWWLLCLLLIFLLWSLLTFFCFVFIIFLVVCSCVVKEIKKVSFQTYVRQLQYTLWVHNNINNIILAKCIVKGKARHNWQRDLSRLWQ